jgi:Tfp pilus assembly protein PilE
MSKRSYPYPQSNLLLALLLSCLVFSALADLPSERLLGEPKAPEASQQYALFQAENQRSTKEDEGAPRPEVGGGGTLWDVSFLRRHLPSGTFLYARLPSAWGLLGAPKGNLFDQAQSSSAYVEALLNIRKGLLDNVLPEFPPEGRWVAEVLLAHVRAPLEMAVLPPGQGSGLPQVIACTTLDSGDPTVVNELLSRLLGQMPQAQLKSPLSSNGSGLALVQGLPLELYLDGSNRRLFLSLADPSKPFPGLPSRIAEWSSKIENHPMRTTEAALDESGQGLFLWMAPNPMLQVLETQGLALEAGLLRAFGASEAKAIAFGIGGSNGKQRIKMVLDMPQVGLRGFIPVIDTDFPLRSAGDPNALVMFGLPGPDDLNMLEANLRGVLPPNDFEKYEKSKEQLAKTLGFKLEMLLSAFGDEVALVLDESGHYLALRVRDQKAYHEVLNRLVQEFHLPHETRELQGTIFHHLILPALPSAPVGESGDKVLESPLARRFLNVPNHLFWIEREGYLLLNNTPQTLMDYLSTKHPTSVANWLRKQQGVEPAGSLLLASTSTEGVPRTLYELNLQFLAYLGDVVGHPVDLFTLPSSGELGLPDAGAFSLAMNSSPRQLSLELVYESNPIEALLSFGSMNTAFMGGILAAIAIPAYQDYLLRAKVSQGIVELQGLKERLTGFYLENGRFLNAEEARSLVAQGNRASSTINWVLEPETGVISATFNINGIPKGSNGLTLTPDIRDNRVQWQCQSSLNPKYLHSLDCTH